MTAAPSLTSVSCLTPPGQGAIAVLALQGEQALAITHRIFRSRNAAHPMPSAPSVGSIWLGRLAGELPDDVVVCVKALEPAPWIEIHCHGGLEIVRHVQAECERLGAVACRSSAIVRRAAPDPIRGAALVLLPGALTLRTAAILLDQARGALGEQLSRLREAWTLGENVRAGDILQRLLAVAPTGGHLTTPWKVVIAGPPNVGKSSLLNALAGYQRCIVSATPGTTRDVVTCLIAAEGWPIELADTAGLRAQAAGLELEGMARAQAAIQQADCCLWVLDAAGEPERPDGAYPNMQLVINKTDLPPTWDLDQYQAAVRVSAKTGAGMAELCRAMGRWLVPYPPQPGEGVPFTMDLGTALTAAWEHHCAGRFEASRLAVEDGIRQLEDEPIAPRPGAKQS